MIQKSKRTSLFLRTLWYLVSWAFVAFAIVAVFFLGLLPVLLQPLMKDHLAEIGRESESARLRYVNPFYIQVDDFGYKTPAFEFSTDKVTVDMNPSDWFLGRPGVINVEGYRLNVDFDRLKNFASSPGIKRSILLQPLEDMAVMFFPDRMYVKDAILEVNAGGISQDYPFSFFSRQHVDGHFFSLQTGANSDSIYKINGDFNIGGGNGSFNVNGSEKSPELWLEGLKVCFGVSLPVDVTFDHGLDFEAQLEVQKCALSKWVLLGWQRGMNIAGANFNAVIENLSFGCTGSLKQYFQSSLMGDVNDASVYGNDFGSFSFEVIQKGETVYGKVPQMFLNSVLIKDIELAWSVSNCKDAIPQSIKFNVGNGTVSIGMQNANEYEFCTIDFDAVDLAYLSGIFSKKIESEMFGEVSGHAVAMINSEDIIIKEFLIKAPSELSIIIPMSGVDQEVVLKSLLLDKRGKDLFLKTNGTLNGQIFDFDQSILHFVPVLQNMLISKGIQLTLD